MLTPRNENAERLLRDVYQITMVEGKIIPESALDKTPLDKTHLSVQTKSLITKRQRAKNYMRRNKRKAVIYGIGLSN